MFQAKLKSLFQAKVHAVLLALSLALMSSAWAANTVTVTSQGPRLSRILRGETGWVEESKKNEEWPGSQTLKLANALPDLELRLWEVGTRYFLEFVLNSKNSNMEILDMSRISPINDPSDGTGFFWAQLPGGSRVAIDMTCDSRKKQCSGKWEDFKYQFGSKQIVSVFSSMRGFEKRQWKIALEPGHLEKIPAGSMPQANMFYSAHGDKPGGTLAQTIVYNKDNYKNPFSELQYSPIRIDLWQIKKNSQESGIGLHLQPRPVLYEVTDGVAKIDLVTGTQYSTFEVRKGERLWTPGNSGLSVRASGGKGEDSAVLRRVEFP